MQITRSQTNLAGREFILDADGDSSITADTDDQIDIKIGGTDEIIITGTDFTLTDSLSLTLGTGKDSRIYYDGTDTFWDLRAVGTGDLMIALAGSFPSPDPNSVHIWGGSAGVVDALSGFPGLIVENNDHAAISILTPANRQGRLIFGNQNDNDVGFLLYNHGDGELSITVDGTNQLIMGDGTFAFQVATDITTPVASTIFVGDTANANMTTGVTINQGTADDQVLAFKSSDIAHGITGQSETDTWGYIAKRSATEGGMHIVGFSEAERGVHIDGYLGSVTTVKSTATEAGINLRVALKDGTGLQYPTADANLVCITSWDGSTNVMRFIFDVEGSGHADVEWVAFDDYDDLALVDDLEEELVARDGVEKTARRHMLEDAKIIGRDSWHKENGKLRAMVNFTKLSMLHHGALRQAHQRIEALEENVKMLTAGGR